MDEEILQDFIVEAGEIIEKLDEQLVQIEKTPDDKELLNAIFRGFHTVKGGAGFLQLNSLVEVCHAAENLFDELRNGRISMSSDLMDAVLAAYDEITAMFENVKNGETLPEPPADLIERLHALASGQQVAAAAPKAEPKPEPAPAPEPAPVADPTPKSEEKKDGASDDSIDDITEDEFEALLDQLHGKGNAPGSDHDKQLEEDATDQDFDELLKKADESLNDVKSRKDEPAKEETPVKAPASAPAAPAPVPQAPAKKGTDIKATKLVEAETTVRVDTKVLDDIMNMVGELVLVRNRLVNMAQHRSDDHDLSKTISNLDVITGDLQSAVMKTRMQPVKKVFGRFPRVVRDLAHKLGKKIELRMEGEDTELDKNLVDALADPMVHMVRNCCDHGIETPKERLLAGKSETVCDKHAIRHSSDRHRLAGRRSAG